MANRSRDWVFTVNNYTETNYEELCRLFETEVTLQYAIIGKEKCPSTGTLHLQGYCYYESARTFTKMQKVLTKGCHIEKAKGTPKQNQTYCSKEGDAIEFGILPEQGKRNDLEVVRTMIEETGSIRYVIDNANSLQSIKTALAILPYKEPVRTWKPRVVWYYGPPGSGKSRTAKSQFPDLTTRWISNDNGKWFDGYDGHPNVILDDVRPATFNFTQLLRLLDWDECRVEIKGGYRQFLAKNIVITSVLKPNLMDWPPGEPVEQLLRRIDELFLFFLDQPPIQVPVIPVVPVLVSTAIPGVYAPVCPGDTLTFSQ